MNSVKIAGGLYAVFYKQRTLVILIAWLPAPYGARYRMQRPDVGKLDW